LASADRCSLKINTMMKPTLLALATGLAPLLSLASVPDDLQMLVVCSFSADAPKGGARMYVEMDYEAYVNYDGANFEADIAVPAGCEPFEHMYLTFGPFGHPAWDGKGNGYGQKHFDIHFYVISNAERVEKMGECVTYPGAGNCAPPGTVPGSDANAGFFEEADATYTTGFYNEQVEFGRHAVPGHGLHLIYAEDARAGGPAACESSGENGDWQDCLAQQLSVLQANPPGTGVFVDHGCTCGTWDTGVSPVAISYGGEVVAWETMPTVTHPTLLEDTLGNPYLGPFPEAEAYAREGLRPSATYSHKTTATIDGVERDRIRLGLELVPTSPSESGEEGSDGGARRGSAGPLEGSDVASLVERRAPLTLKL